MSFEDEYRALMAKPIDEIKPDIFFRYDNFRDEPWYEDVQMYRAVGICVPAAVHALQVRKARCGRPNRNQRRRTAMTRRGDSMKRFYIFKDGTQVGSAVTKEQAIYMIRQHQALETHPILRAEFSMIEGEEEFIRYPSQQKPPRKKSEMER